MSVVRTRRSYWPSACRVVFQLAAWFVQVPAPIGERWKVTVSTPEPPVSAELLVRPIVPRTLALSAGAVTEPVGFSVVDAHGDRRRGVGVAGQVGGDDAEVVLAVGLQSGVPAGGLVRPGACAGGGALEADRVDAGAAEVGGVAGEHDGAANVRCVGRAGDRAGRVGVVDEHCDRRRGGGVAGLVGGEDAEVVLAVGLQGGVPAGGLVCPGACAGGGALEGDGVDAGAAVSAELLVKRIVSRTLAASAGAVTEPVGIGVVDAHGDRR